MKKLLLILVAATMTLTGFAAGTGDGSSKANAIEFNWDQGNTQEAGTSWYKVTFGNRLDIDAPNLALYLTNLSSSSAKVEISALYAADEEKRDYTIAGNGSKVWNTSASMIKNMVKDEEGLFVKLTTTQKVHLSAKVFEGSLADDACLKATAYDDAPHSLKAGTHWYTINAAELREKKQGIQITYAANKGTSKIVSMISTDCPSTGLAGLKGSIPNGKTKVHEISPVLIQNMSEATIYLKVENSKEISVTTVPLTLPEQGVDFTNPTDVVFNDKNETTPYDIATIGRVFRVKLSDLIPVEVEKGDRKKYLEPQIAFNNEDNAAETAVMVEIAFKNDAVDDYNTVNVITKEETIIAGETGFLDFARTVLESLDKENCAYVYIRITPVQNIKASARLKHMREGNACGAAQSVKWNETIYQKVEVDEENSTQWYEVDLTGLKDETNPQDVTVSITNSGDATATVTAEIAYQCPYIDLTTITRQIEVGKPLSKTLNYSTIATLASNKIYVGVTTTEDVIVKAVHSKAVEKDASEVTCDKAEEYKPVDFNLEEGHRQDKDIVVWYKVKAATIKEAFGEDIPELVVTNEGDKTLTIKAELSRNCPDIYENQKRSLTIGANGIYKKEIAKDLFVGYDKNAVFYIKLTGNQPFNFRLNKKIENEGASCAKAIPFNWTAGHNQNAEETLWYVIDLTEIQNTKGKKVHVLLKNLTGKDATIDAVLSSECPVSSPQSQTVQLKGAQIREKDIARSSFTAFGEKVYIRLQGTQKFHFEASIQDAENFEPIDITNLTPVQYNVTTDKVADDAWYSIDLDRLCNNDSTARLMIINDDAAQSIKASIAYEPDVDKDKMQVTEEMQTATRTFVAKQQMSKVIERSMFEQLCAKGIKTVYVRVEAAKKYQFRVDIIDPNTGVDCMHAREIVEDKALNHEAGKTLWYKLNVANFLNRDDKDRIKLNFRLKNTDGKAGAVQAAAFTDCEGKELMAGNASIGANATREKAVMVDALAGLSSQWLYLQLTAAQKQEILMTVVKRDTLDPSVDLCDDNAAVIPFAVNTDYNQKANDSVWYAVNIKEIRENTSGDATLIVTELSGEENTLKAEMSWTCEIKYEMTNKSMMLKGNDVYTRTFSRDMLNTAEGKDIVYVRVISEKAMKFRVNMHLNKGDECSNPIEFDWKNGNTNPQGTCLWYNVSLLDENGDPRVPEGKDLQLTIINLGDVTSSANADIRPECKESSLGDGHHTFGPKGAADRSDTLIRVIDRELLYSTPNSNYGLHLTSFVINFCTPKTSMYIRVDTIPERPREKFNVDTTIMECWSEIADHDSIFNDEFTNTIVPHKINPDDKNSLDWYTTKTARVGTMLVDTIFHVTFIPMVAADGINFNNDTIVDDYKIIAKEGEKLDYSAFENYLVMYYTNLMNSADSLANYKEFVGWMALNPATGEFEDIAAVEVYQTELTKETPNIVLSYAIANECGDEISGDVYVTVEPIVPECDPVFDLTTLTDLYWPIAFCGTIYDVDAVKAQIQAALDAAGSTDVVTIHYNGDAEYNNEKMVSGESVTFYAKVTSTCDASTSVTASKTMTVISADGKDNQVTTLPLVDPFAGDKIDNKILLIDVNAINAGNYGLTLPQYYDTENLVKWYRMVGTEADPTKDELVQEGGYYLTTDNEKLESGAYYAVIEVVNAAAGECDGEWRTIVYAVSKPATVSKRMINGKLYIVTEDNVIYDAQGQKVQ